MVSSGGTWAPFMRFVSAWACSAFDGSFAGVVAPAGGRGLCLALAPTYLPGRRGHAAAGFAALVVLLRDRRARSASESNVLPQDGQALGSFKKS